MASWVTHHIIVCLHRGSTVQRSVCPRGLYHLHVSYQCSGFWLAKTTCSDCRGGAPHLCRASRLVCGSNLWEGLLRRHRWQGRQRHWLPHRTSLRRDVGSAPDTGHRWCCLYSIHSHRVCPPAPPTTCALCQHASKRYTTASRLDQWPIPRPCLKLCKYGLLTAQSINKHHREQDHSEF